MPVGAAPPGRYPSDGDDRGAFTDNALAQPATSLAVLDTLTFSQAAANPTGLATEYDALVTQVGFRRGNSVLIVGATSAVGIVAVQLAKSLGTLIATTTSDAKRPALQHVGADVTVNTRPDNLVDAVRSATHGRGVDVVLDYDGGAVFASLPMSTAISGSILNIGPLGGKDARVDLDHVAFRRIHIIGATFSVQGMTEVTAVVAALAPIVAGPVADGLIRPVVDRTYDLENAVNAAQRIRSNEATGKIGLTVADQQRPQP